MVQPQHTREAQGQISPFMVRQAYHERGNVILSVIRDRCASLLGTSYELRQALSMGNAHHPSPLTPTPSLLIKKLHLDPCQFDNVVVV